MKKIIYGLIVLLGIGFISTNFIVDTSTLDHKTVKAGGTACKWISDTGYYGLAPVYYIAPDKTWWSYADGHYRAETYANILTNHLTVVPCSSNNSGNQLSYGIIYDKNLNPLSSILSPTSSAYFNKNNSFYIEVQNGYVVEGKYKAACVMAGDGHYAGGNCAIETFEDENRMLAINYKYNLSEFNHITPTKYTCICAEY